jgi:hypothetical protein
MNGARYLLNRESPLIKQGIAARRACAAAFSCVAPRRNLPVVFVGTEIALPFTSRLELEDQAARRLIAVPNTIRGVLLLH